jgi:hypothetical protein
LILRQHCPTLNRPSLHVTDCRLSLADYPSWRNRPESVTEQERDVLRRTKISQPAAVGGL